MVDIGFYHCTRAPAVTVAVRLLAKAYTAGKRVLVTGGAEDLDALDTALWAEEPHSFVPHAVAGVLEDEAQPILLVAGDSAGTAAGEGAPADSAVIVEGAPVNGATVVLSLGHGLPAGFERYERVLNLFEDGSDAHTRARADWKALAALSAATRSYWQQAEGGGWEKKG